jgi:type IV secretion system protein VirB5
MIKKLLSIFGVITALMFSNASFAGIPVIDAANLAQAVEQVSAWAQQYQQMATQFQQMQQDYASVTGQRGFQSLINDESAREYLPQTASEMVTLTPYASQISANITANQIINPSTISDVTTQNDVTAKQKFIATYQAATEASFNQAGQRFSHMQTLIDSIGSTPDPKAIAELNARIAAESAMLQNEQLKVQLANQVYQSQMMIQAQQQREKQLAVGTGTYIPATFTP